MQAPDLETAVTERFGELAAGSCCLSFGGAADLAAPRPGEVGLDLGSGRGQDALRMAVVQDLASGAAAMLAVH